MDSIYELSVPICIGIITTNKCNLKCKHCINSAAPDCTIELSTEQIKDIINQCCEIGVCYVDFNGGEFFTRADVDELIDYALLKKLNITITSNGTLISDQWIEKYSGKISLVRISLDNNIEQKHDEFRGVRGAFRKTIETIKKLVKNGYRVTILTTIVKSSLHNLYNFFDFLDSLHVSAVHTTLLMPVGRGSNIIDEVLTPKEHRLFLDMCYSYSSERKPKHLHILEESPQSNLLRYEKKELAEFKVGKCGAGFTEMVVLNDGYVLPCAAFISQREKYKQDELNIFCKDLNWIYHNSYLMNAVRDISKFEGKCKKCIIKNKCGGGCRIPSLMSGNGIYGEDSMCWYNESNMS